MIAGILLLALVAVVAYAVMRAIGGTRGGTPGEFRPEHDLREEVVRFFRLALLFGATVLVAEGVAGLIAEVLPRSGGDVRDPGDIARALAFTVVGVPVLAGLGRWTQRRLAVDPDEAASAGWGLLLTVALTVSLAVAMTAWHALLRGVIAASPAVDATIGGVIRAPARFEPDTVGRAVAWAAVWAVHWRLLRTRPAAGGRIDAPVAIGSIVGLTTVTVGAGVALSVALRIGYDRLADELLLGGGTAELRRTLPTVVVGALVWWWYWLRHGERATREGRWYALVLLAGVAAPLAAAVVGAARLLHAALQWFLGDPGVATAAEHFGVVPTAVATTLVGLAGWTYHRGLLGPGEVRTRHEADRVYEYLASAVGLVVSVIGVTVAFVSLAETVSDPRDTFGADRGVANTVVFAATMVMVGLPVWGWFWRRAQRHAAEPGERAAISRRVYLLALFGVASMVALVSLVLALFFGFDDIARGVAGSSTLFRLRIPGALVLTMAVIAGYHALVYRADRAALAGAPSAVAPGAAAGWAGNVVGRPVLRSLVVLGPAPAADELARTLHERLDLEVRVWHTTTYEPCGPVDLDALVATLAGTDARHALVTMGPSGPTVAGFDPA